MMVKKLIIYTYKYIHIRAAMITRLITQSTDRKRKRLLY